MKKLVFATILWVVFAGPLLSQAEEEQTEKESLTTMEEVVVTATKTEEKRKDISNSLIVMDEIDIEESSAKSLGELLANELGIDWRTQGNYGGAAEEIHIRGMSGNATQVFVNGVSINSPSLGIADVGRIPLNNIERIEVVKGSGSLLYGSGAMGGTVNIITKRPKREKMDLKVSAGYGTENSYQVSAEQGMFVLGDFGYFLTANRRGTDGFRDNSELEHQDVSLKLVFENGDALDISLYGDYIERDYGVPGVKPPAGTEEFFVRGIKVYNDEAESLLNNGSDEDWHGVLEVKSQATDWLGFRLMGNYTNMENYNYLRYVDFFGNLLGSKSWTMNKVYGVEGNINVKPFKGANLLLASEYKNFDWENKGVNLDGSGTEIEGSATTTEAGIHTIGIFSEAQYRPCRFIKAIAGIRHEDHSQFGRENLPRFGLILNPTQNTALKATHGKHFLAPTPNDLYWPNDGFTKGDPNLEPEKGWHTDATFEQTLFEDKFFITFSYFHWDLDNKIQWGPDSNGVWTPQNLRKYKADGYEVGTKVGPFCNLSLGLNYTHLDAEEENKAYTRQDYGWPPWIPPDFRYTWVKRRAAYTPEHQFKGTLTYWSNFGLTAAATARYVSDRVWYRTETDVAYPATKTVAYTLDSYWTVDLKFDQRLYDHLILSLQCNNLLDEEYDTYFGTFTDQGTGVTSVVGYPGAGISFFFSIAYEY